jgi:hypothetical protein
MTLPNYNALSSQVLKSTQLAPRRARKNNVDKRVALYHPYLHDMLADITMFCHNCCPFTSSKKSNISYSLAFKKLFIVYIGWDSFPSPKQATNGHMSILVNVAIGGFYSHKATSYCSFTQAICTHTFLLSQTSNSNR